MGVKPLEKERGKGLSRERNTQMIPLRCTEAEAEEEEAGGAGGFSKCSLV